jgi:2-polyprenyl-3-methyl-5-hydroxy-6-metoxy-1,4-benzoquinol methylase
VNQPQDLADLEMNDAGGYLRRMSNGMADKIRVARFLAKAGESVLDVGCADGAVTKALAVAMPGNRFKGIDTAANFIDAAKRAAGPNTVFRCCFLRDLLLTEERFSAVTFMSVLHEFFTYGSGITSVVKALADARELLLPNGRVIIRDMALPRDPGDLRSVVEKVKSKTEYRALIANFERYFGALGSANINHFLLKYFYTNNWDRECPENYTPVSIEEYHAILNVLRMKLLHSETYTLPFLAQKWATDFGLSSEEVSALRSTSVIVAVPS